MPDARDVKIIINSERYEVEASLFSEIDDEEDILELLNGEKSFEPEKMEIKTFGKISTVNGRTDITYDETELTGMEGSSTTVFFENENTGIVTMVRTGEVSTALVFEAGRRHHCVYKTPYMPFEVCVRTISVKNDIRTNGNIEIDYVIEIRGARAERTKFSMRIS